MRRDAQREPLPRMDAPKGARHLVGVVVSEDRDIVRIRQQTRRTALDTPAVCC
jgi:hypothetical protein